MSLEYVPDTSAVGNVDFRPFMIEVAWDYCNVVLASTHQRHLVEESLATLAIEIVLKSYNSVPVSHVGKVNETYEFRPAAGIKVANKHNLVDLAAILPQGVRSYLIDPPDEEVLQGCQNAFSKSRYCYEATAPTSSTGSAMRLAVKLICKTIWLYKQRECNDPFIAAFVSVQPTHLAPPEGIRQRRQLASSGGAATPQCGC